jgi:hypothetical protein
MSKVGLLCGLFGASLLCIDAGAVELPAGPNRDFVARLCGSCHDLDMVNAAAGLDREGWNGAVEEMISYGLKVSPEEKAMLLDYLASALGPDAKK